MAFKFKVLGPDLFWVKQGKIPKANLLQIYTITRNRFVWHKEICHQFYEVILGTIQSILDLYFLKYAIMVQYTA